MLFYCDQFFFPFLMREMHDIFSFECYLSIGNIMLPFY
jgi:hypothetical protein